MFVRVSGPARGPTTANVGRAMQDRVIDLGAITPSTMTRDWAPQASENLRPMLDINGSEFLAASFIYDLAIRVIRAFLASRWPDGIRCS